MRGRRRMNGEAPRVADIGDVVEQLQRIDEAPPRLLAALEFEADEPAIAALEVFVGALAEHARLHRRMDDARHLGPLQEIIRHGLRVLGMALDAQGQRLDALDGQERVEGRQRGAEIAQQRHARLDDIGDGAERLHGLGPDRAVIGGIGRVERGLARGMRGPVEIAAIDEKAADRGAVAAEILRGRSRR